MLENNMENAEHPEKLIIYGGNGKYARNWESYHAIVKSLKELEDDETCSSVKVCPWQYSRPIKYAPVVCYGSDKLHASDIGETFYDLEAKNLTIFAQYTAAP